MPKNGKRLYKVTATDIDWLPENKNVSFSITSEKIIRLSENRNLRMEKSQTFTFDVGLSGIVTLARPLKPKIHYYEITVTAANKAAGPKSSIIIRFFPVTQDETVIVKTTNFARFDENSFIDELGQLIEEQSTVVINDMKNVLDSDGNPINEAEIAFHVWTGERNLIATDKIVSSLESVNARKFVQDHYLAFPSVDPLREKDENVFFIVIGVLGVLLIISIFTATTTIVLMKRKMDRKWRAEMVQRRIEQETIEDTRPVQPTNLNPLRTLPVSEKYLTDYIPEESKSDAGDSDRSTFDDILDSSDTEIQQEEL